MVKCETCGRWNQETAQDCWKCGTCMGALPAPDDIDTVLDPDNLNPIQPASNSDILSIDPDDVATI